MPSRNPNIINITNQCRERRIEAAFQRLRGAATRAERLAAWERLRMEIGRRSQEQIERMEAEKGLSSNAKN